MKINSNHSLLLLAVVAGIAATIPAAFAAEVEVVNAPGSSVPGCEETNECFIPGEVTIAIGDTVTWVNDDTAAHTTTSGDPAGGPDGNWDSSLVMVGQSFSNTFDEAGEYPYFCMVHPWMAGMITVGEAMGEEAGVMINIESQPVGAGESMTINVEFVKMEGETKHVNYNIMATQDGQVVLDEQGVHDHDGVMSHTTMALPSAASGDNPVDVDVEFLGFGLPDDDPSTWTGPIGQMGETQVVPEFGTIAVMILGVAIISIIAVTARSKVIPRL
jgi:predicted secreted protein with PEFG-CTERM motif